MIVRVEVNGNNLITYNEDRKRIKKSYNKGGFLGNSSKIVVKVMSDLHRQYWNK